MLVENFWNSHPGGAFNFGIGIDERDTESGSESSTDRRFAGTHHTDEHDRAVAERADYRGFRAIFRRFLDGVVNHAMIPRRIHGSIYQQSRRTGQSCQRFRNVVVTRLKSLGAGARTLAGFDHAESIQISGFSRPARRPGLRYGVLTRNLCEISATRDHRDYTARQISQKSLTPETR